MPNSFDNLELVTTVNPTLRSVDGANGIKKEVYQFIYASQLYGTTFAVYGRFNLDEQINTNDICCIKSLDLKLLNYRGLINLGFTDDPIDEDLVSNKNMEDHEINFRVRCLSKSREHSVTFKKPILLNKGTVIRLTFNRILLPLEGYMDASGVHDLSLVKKMNENYLNDDIFDTEFMERSGTEYYHKPLVPGLENSNMMEEAIDSNKMKIKIVSHRCHQSNVNLYF